MVAIVICMHVYFIVVKTTANENVSGLCSRQCYRHLGAEVTAQGLDGVHVLLHCQYENQDLACFLRCWESHPEKGTCEDTTGSHGEAPWLPL